MTKPEERQKLYLGPSAIIGNTSYKLIKDDIRFISSRIKDRVNETVGKVVISGVGDELVADTFEIVRLNYGNILTGGGITLFDQLADKTIDIIATDAISHYTRKETESTRTIWTSVDRVHSQNVNGQGMINKKGVSGSSVALRF
jgi:hypothetical protein